MKIEQFYQDNNITYVTGDDRHRHARHGWVHIECPFCSGNPGYHLGYDLNNEYFTCWRCGGHTEVKTIAALLEIPYNTAYSILLRYGGSTQKQEKTKHTNTKPYQRPSNIQPLTNSHKKYLENRNFDPAYLQAVFDVQSCGPISSLDGLKYNHRLFIPVNWLGEEVSFQTRAINDKGMRYMVCPQERELIHHKHILYGRTDKWQETLILVEGVTDVWRMGMYSAATFGIKYTPRQLRYLGKTFKRIAVLYDPDPQAQQQARKLVGDLKFRGVDAFNICIETDPGDLPQMEADYLVKQII